MFIFLITKYILRKLFLYIFKNININLYQSLSHTLIYKKNKPENHINVTIFLIQNNIKNVLSSKTVRILVYFRFNISRYLDDLLYFY